jgi:hypothetical protein
MAVDSKGHLYVADASNGRIQKFDISNNPQRSEKGVRLERVRNGLIRVQIDGRLFTAFNYGADAPKPFLYPVIGPRETPMTRNFPMKDAPYEREHKRQDHAHHRSIWTAWGDVRSGSDEKGIDYWAEGPECGLQKVTRIVRTVTGPTFGELEAEVEWMTPSGRRQLTENRTYRFTRGEGELRIIDVKVVFRFTDGPVMFGDTSEGGIVAVRLATQLDEVGGGRIHNAHGQTGEGQCWGKPADWCDYVGTVEGAALGISILDAPSNLNHPPRWHIRGYGLFAVNPIGLRDFTGGSQTRSQTWAAGETVEFDCRILLHEGTTEGADIAGRYRAYARAPAEVTTAAGP